MTGSPPVTADYVRNWSRRAHGSPLYRSLSAYAAEDPELMRLMGRIEHRPAPNLLFASVHLLLMRGAETPLRDHYASLVDDPKPADGAAPVFKAFALAHEDWIVATSNTRYTQTNEAKRCIALLPAVWFTRLESFHLVEIGASAGLNLALDRYSYRWGEVTWGPDSPVVLEAASRGGRVRPARVEILSRTGLDLHPVDFADPDDRDWLFALIWPDHRARRDRLERALAVAGEVEMEMVEGDATRTLPEVLARLPGDEPVVVMNSMSLMQFGRPQRDSLYASIGQGGAHTTLRRVSFEILAAGDEWVTLSADAGAGLAQIGQAHPHGEWIDLYARP